MIRPLLKKSPRTGKDYVRPANITARLAELVTLEPAKLVERARIRDRSDPNYLPNECLLYFVRSGRAELPEPWFKVLYELLMSRVYRALSKGIGSEEKAINLGDANHLARSWAFDRFVELISEDQYSYDERLDFYEVRFNSALSCLRKDMFDKAVSELDTLQPLSEDPDTRELSPDIERARGFEKSPEQELLEKEFRIRLEEAINALPSEQRTVITLYRKGVPFDSKVASKQTIAKELKKTEKTVRNYRDLAQATLKTKLFPEDLP